MHKKENAAEGRVIEIDGVALHLSHPHNVDSEWIGQTEILHQLLACWLVVDKADLPLAPRLVGPPGIGKTAAGHGRRQDAKATALHLSMYRGHSAGRLVGHARLGRKR
ncbi:MAG: hypothetical protein R3C28_03140 [Pirellulaceae bacterium]